MPNKPHGLSIELSRGGAVAEPAPWHYRGKVTRGEGSAEVSATVAADGEVDVTADDAAIAERVRLLLRACYKQSVAEGLVAPPRKIVRWREERV